MPTNDFLAFATGGGALVMPQADYLAAAFRTAGFGAGIADPASFNKTWRQAAFVAAGLAQFIVNTSAVNVLDDADLTGFVTKLNNAIHTAAGGVTTFNARSGAVTLSSADVLGALGFTPLDKAGGNTATGLIPFRASIAAAGGASINIAPGATPTGLSNGDIWVDAAGAYVRINGVTVTFANPGAAAVTSFNTRTGAITLTGGDVTTALGFPPLNAASNAVSATKWATARTITAGTDLSGSVSLDGTASVTLNLTIAAGAVTLGKIQNIADQTLLGNVSGGGAPAALSNAQVNTFLPTYVGDAGAGGTKGLVVAPAAGDGAAGKVLRADGTWGYPAVAAEGSFAGQVTNGACAVNRAVNVASVSRTASGAYVITWTTPFADAFYPFTLGASGQNNAVNWTAKTANDVTIWIQQGNANVGTGPINPAEVTFRAGR